MTTTLAIANVALLMGAIIGMYLIAQRDKRGFIVFLVVESSMAYIGIVSGNYGLVITAGVYLCMNVYSYIKWSRGGL